MKIVVLAGGLSPEREVSLASGSLIANALMDNGHKVCLLDLYLGRVLVESYEQLFHTKEEGVRYEHKITSKVPELKELTKEDKDKCYIGENVISICRYADVVFLSLHGSAGENGQIQAVFDCYGIRYTGSGYVGSLLAMDKDVSKQIMKRNHILTPAWVTLSKRHDLSQNLNEIESGIGYPCVVKPCSGGSSIGVSIVKSREELHKAIEEVKEYEDMILIEKKIEGREFSIGILEGEALPIIEIIPMNGFYDYYNKYQISGTKEVCPADVDEKIAKRMQLIALATHCAHRLGSYSRVDFIMDKNDNMYCLEVNTLPGMTPTSLLPQEAKAAEISYHELCERILQSSNRC